MKGHRLWSAPGTHLAQLDEDVVILNVPADRYDCLLDVAGVLRVIGPRDILALDRATCAELLASGIAVRPRADRAPETFVPAARELSVDLRPPPSDILRAAIVLTSATLRFRGRNFEHLVSVRPVIRGPASSGPARLSQLVGAARAARAWIPFEGECLQRSFLLRAFLAAQGVATDWVFGVRTWPFAAHCWLQIDDMVVGDRLERAGRFTPILRV